MNRILLTAVAVVLAAAPALATPVPAGYEHLDGARQGAYLRYGSQGVAVQALQGALSALGYPVTPTGFFGTVTQSRVRAFQASAGIAVDGIVGPQTVRAMDARFGYVPGSSGGTTGGATTGGGGSTSGGGTTGGTVATGIPPRSPSAITGSQFIAWTRGMSRPQREAAILQEIASGNIPSFLRSLKTITVTMTGPDLRPHWAQYRVMPDYLAIGADWDCVRIPMNPLTGQRIADLFGCSMPTRRMVNQIWSAAPVKLSPIPMMPGAAMMSNDYFATHNARIQAQLGGRAPGDLVAGHKKDVVISNRLLTYPNRVAIYGWHYLNGTPIQPLSTVHENTYADYSHGVRLVDARVVVDGQVRPIADVLRDPILSALLSDEGPMPSPRQPGVP